MYPKHTGFTVIILLCCLCAVAQEQKKEITAKADTTNTRKCIAAPAVKDNSKTDSLMVLLLSKYPQYFDSIVKNKQPWNVQFVYTQIDRNAKGMPDFKNYYFNVNPDHYFYPASAVKLPICLLALQKLNELKQYGIDKNTTMITEHVQPGQTSVYNDPASADGRPTIATYIKKILMVSDNDAYNRLYEFLGRQYINEQLHQKGYQDVQLLHRLGIALNDEQNKTTNPIIFLDSNNNTLYRQDMQYDTTKYAQRQDTIGKAYLKGGSNYYNGDQLVNTPMDFSGKNRISLADLHNILLSIIYPEKVTTAERFNLTADDKNFILKYMSQLPTESTFPPYAADTSNYWPAYCKFLMYGSERGTLPKNIRIFNKVGDAYGQLTDVAYIVDFDKKIEFFLSATVYCNSDGILNDDKYDYDTVGYPFMKHLGEVIYKYEIERKKEIQPDLSNLIFNYDKP
jgi:beta-lactamase class A